MKVIYKSNFFCFCVLIIFLIGCRISKHLPEGKYLLAKNEIVINNPLEISVKNISKAELERLALPAANKQIVKWVPVLNIRPKLWIWQTFDWKKEHSLNWWIKNKIGEPPALYDSTKTLRSALNMQNYLFNKGYFYSHVNVKTKKLPYQRKVTYEVNTGKLYVLSNIEFHSENDTIDKLINQFSFNSLLKTGDPFDIGKLKEERERIEILLRNNGYYEFSQEYVFYTVDTLLAKTKKQQLLSLFAENKKPISIRVNVKNPSSGYHQKFFVDRVYIFPNTKTDSSKYSTSDSIHFSNYIFVSKKLSTRPSLILSKVFVQPHDYFNFEQQQLTTNHLSELGIYKSVSVNYTKVSANHLDCTIYMQPNKKRDYTATVESSTNAEFFGGAVNLAYSTRNFFRTGDLLSYNLKGSLESPFENKNSQLSTKDLTAGVSLLIPKFTVPFRLKQVPKYQNPKSRLSFTYSILKRMDYYTQYSNSLSWAYDWNETAQKHQTFTPFALNFIQIYKPSQAFNQILDNNPILKSSYQQVLITGGSEVYTFNSRSTNNKKNNYYFRGIVDVAGNSLYALNRILNKLNNDSLTKPLRFFGIDYSQFVKLGIENSYHLNITKHQDFVTHASVGAGFAYGNSKVMPYVKQFYGGGPNDLRAWRVRTVGPGTYSDSTSNLLLNQTGDMKLVLNLEYRFDIVSYFKGALFTDAGNIWLLHKDALRPGAEFIPSEFYKQLAVGAGAGLRMDFTYFLIRMDCGFRLVDPARPEGERVVTNTIKPLKTSWWKNDIKYNLAINYPF